MEHKRKCPLCNKELTYKTKDGYMSSCRLNKCCRSCSTKKVYANNPNKNKGLNNGRSGKKLSQVMIDKYGEKEGIARYDSFLKQLTNHSFKKGKDNPSYGITPINSGWSYKGWYKNLFFRSSFELVFILEFETTNNRLPLSAEKTFRIKYGDKTYCPDFFDPILSTLFEIKAERFLNESTNLEKFKAAELFVKNNNLKFVVLTEKQLNYAEGGIVWKLKKLNDEGIIKLTNKSVDKLNNRLKKLAEAIVLYKQNKKQEI